MARVWHHYEWIQFYAHVGTVSLCKLPELTRYPPSRSPDAFVLAHSVAQGMPGPKGYHFENIALNAVGRYFVHHGGDFRVYYGFRPFGLKGGSRSLLSVDECRQKQTWKNEKF